VTRRPTLSRRLVLEARALQPDGSGGVDVAWVPLGTLHADVTPRSGREDFVGGQTRPRVRYRILVRGAPVGAAARPRPDQRLRDGGRVFDIVTVTEADAGGRFLEIVAEEGVGP
jgi:head-tail adaptor